MHTSTPFRQAIHRETSDQVAVKHYEWLKRGLEAARVPVTPYNIALAWNSGLSAVTSGRAPRVAHDYARRATNLAATYESRRQEQLLARQEQMLAELERARAAIAAQ
jgi:hypothetical protein